MVRDPVRLVVALGLVLTFPLSAGADFPSVNVRAFTPPTDPNGSLYLEPTPTPGPASANAAAWFAYQYRPAVLRDANGAIEANLQSYQLSADLVGNIGVGQRLAFGFDLPVVLQQSGEDSILARGATGGPPPAQALGDLALVAKGNLLSYGPIGGFGLSLLLRGTLPTGSRRSYAGEGAARGEARLLAEYELVAVSLQATAGFAPRFAERDVLGRTFHHEVPWGVGISVRPQAFGWDDEGRWTWMVDLHGSALLSPSQAALARGQKAPVSPVLAGVAARLAAKQLSFVLGVESSLTRAFGAPPLQVLVSVQWAPRQADQDQDGVPDDVDQCPELPEDRDGFEDQDGCPDWDNDGDGVPDKEDACPNEAGEAQADPKRNGCPLSPGERPPITPSTPSTPSTPASPTAPAPAEAPAVPPP
jgi:OOP family OmpA-OmpF porin